jgi:tripartite-type tricarboxylate transporter receptor subunit TctC
VQHLRVHPNTLNFASSGIGSPIHMAGELFQLATATRMTHIPFKGMAPAIADLVGGSVEASWLTTITSVPLVEAGRLRMLAVTTAKRVIALPDIPTFAEAGVPGVVVVNWYGLAAPLHTPKAAVDRIANESARIMKSPALASRLAADGSEAMGSTPAEFAALIRAEQNQWAKVIKQAGIVGR